MLVLQKHDQAKKSAGSSHQPVSPAPESKDAPPLNPVWQTLATRVPFIQPKLKVSQPQDSSEHEADRIAQQVTRLPEPQSGRGCDCGVGCPACATSPRGFERASLQPKPIQPKPVQPHDAGEAAIPAVVSEVLTTSGQPLDTTARNFMEPRFGQDFSQVRVHTDERAAESARAVNALAYTSGRDVVFGANQYAPQTPEGRRLLAHELTHVVQQSGSHGSSVGQSDERRSSSSLSQPIAQGNAVAGSLQRAPSKAAATEPCPSYEPGEFQESKQEPGVLTWPVRGMPPDKVLIADFGVGWRHIKDSVLKDTMLRDWLSDIKQNPPKELHILGFSDCVGEEADNLFLRVGRARNVARLLGSMLGAVRPNTVEAAPRGQFVADNKNRLNRAKNRGVTIQIPLPPPQPVPKPRPMVQPQSIAECWDLLEDAQKRLESNAKTAAAAAAWKPDTAGSLERIDAAIAFLRPLVADDNIARHAHDDLQNRTIPVFWTTDHFKPVKDRFEALLLARTHVSQQIRSDEVERAYHNLRSVKTELEVLADEAVSFELDSGVVQAPSFRPEMRAQVLGGATLAKPEVRAFMWLRTQKDVILEAERKFRVDRRAIAATIAWEATQNVMRMGLRAVGPGKMHTYSRKWAAVLPISKGDAIPQQLEQQGYLPAKSDDDRAMMLSNARGSTTYIAAAMRAATDIAAKHGYDISHNLVALTSFYQGHDLNSWESHMEKKQRNGEKDFVAADPMAVWTAAHVANLEGVLGTPSP